MFTSKETLSKSILLMKLWFIVLMINVVFSISSTTPVTSFFDCLYFTNVSYFTVGYGDIVPNPTNTLAKIICLIHLYIAYAVSVLGFMHIFGMPVNIPEGKIDESVENDNQKQ